MSHLTIADPDKEIVSTRIFKTPIAIVFSAWSNAEYLRVWWGPKGFTNTFEQFDFKVGGKWKFVMHGPEKGNYRNECEFTRIEEPFLISWKRHSMPLFEVLVSFEELTKDTTKVVFKQLFETERECSKVKPFAVEKNEENFDRLEAVLMDMSDAVDKNIH